MDDEEKAFLKQVFGDSSESDWEGDGEEELQKSKIEDHHSSNLALHDFSWEEIKGIEGLWVCTDFLSHRQQSSLLSSILNEGWFTEASHNQAMRFGDLPRWATELSHSICETLVLSNKVCVFPSNLLWREPLFDQLIVNVYQPGEGICAHVDLMRFEDGIAIVSLESPCIMHFTRVDQADPDAPRTVESRDGWTSRESKVGVCLKPGSLLLMWGEARYCWKHEINRKPGFQVWNGQELFQEKRISITLRKLCGT